MEQTELQNELASIRSIMERSSKFISLSGLSGVLAGVYALTGAGTGYLIIGNNPVTITNDRSFFEVLGNAITIIISLMTIAGVVLIVSVVTAILLARRQARKKGQPLWGIASRSLLFHMAVPLVTGAALIILFLYQGNDAFIASTMLIFYGLSLVGASNFTFGEVKYLGLCEIILGITAACLPGYGLLFWALGFGALHIIYGARIYFKYDK
jgi:hypothetical protein